MNNLKHQKNSLRGEFYKKTKSQKHIEKQILSLNVFELFIDYKDDKDDAKINSKSTLDKKSSDNESRKTKNMNSNNEQFYSIKDILNKEKSWLDSKVFKMLIIVKDHSEDKQSEVDEKE